MFVLYETPNVNLGSWSKSSVYLCTFLYGHRPQIVKNNFILCTVTIIILGIADVL